METRRRDWLNHDEGMAAVQTIGATEKSDIFESEYVSCSVTIADCSRNITLDFDMFTKEDAVSRQKKLNILRKHMDIIQTYIDAGLRSLPTKKQKDEQHKKEREEAAARRRARNAT